MATLECLIEEFIACVEEMQGIALSRAQKARIRRLAMAIGERSGDTHRIANDPTYRRRAKVAQNRTT